MAFTIGQRVRVTPDFEGDRVWIGEQGIITRIEVIDLNPIVVDIAGYGEILFDVNELEIVL